MITNVREFEALAKSIAPEVSALLSARVIAQMERERVNAYVAPIFAQYDFRATDTGERLTSDRDLYLVADLNDPQVLAYYEATYDAHAAHGWTGTRGYCPALVAEHNVIKAEWALLERASALFGFDFTEAYGEKRTQALDLFIGAGVKAMAEAA